jgi:hypothetical protein
MATTEIGPPTLDDNATDAAQDATDELMNAGRALPNWGARCRASGAAVATRKPLGPARVGDPCV